MPYQEGHYPVAGQVKTDGPDNIQNAAVKIADAIKSVSETVHVIGQFLDRTLGPVPETPNVPESKQLRVSRSGQLGELHDACDSLERLTRELRMQTSRLGVL
jgi:hypothetical protein